MYCSSCGSKLVAETKFCSNCGIDVSSFSSTHSPSLVSPPMGFGEAISICFEKYFVFQGRASRAEYWWFVLFLQLLYLVATMVDLLFILVFEFPMMLSSIVQLATLVPMISVATRRLHDTNKSGWWQLISLTIIGIIPLFIFMVSKGDEQSNRFGPQN